MEVKLINIPEAELREIIRTEVLNAIKQSLSLEINDKPSATSRKDELIGTNEACKILGICARTMQRYRDARYFTVIKRGPHKALYYRHEIEAFRYANIKVNEL